MHALIKFSYALYLHFLEKQLSFIIRLINMKPKPKFYEPSKKQVEEQKIVDIYKMLNQQDKAMSDLLSKYQDRKPIENEFQRQSKTIDHEFLKRNRAIKGEKRSTQRSREIIAVELPAIIHSHAKFLNKQQAKTLSKAKEKQKSLYENPYLAELNSEDRSKKVDHIQKAFLKQRLKNNKSKPKLASATSNPKTSRQKLLSAKISSQQTQMDFQSNSERQYKKEVPKESKIENLMPVPLGYFKENVQEDSSSDEGEVPLNFYERQYRELIRSQCLEQTNFLYFSKNQAMKEWTEALLLLFEKHDKQLVSLRKKCKYLQKFDQNFFTIDIFKE